MVEQLPSGDKTDNLYISSPSERKEIGQKLNEEFLPSAELYVEQSKNIDALISDLKKRIAVDLKDELLRLEYELNAREAEIRRRELLLEQREREVKAREDRLRLAEQANEKKIQDKIEELEREYGIPGSIQAESRGNEGRNPEGVGGRPGSLKSSSTIINRREYQGNNLQLEDGSNLVWNPELTEYELVSANKGLKFTYFAVEAAYLNDNYINPTYPQFYSQTIFQKQVWYEITPKGRKDDGLGAEYQGKVPLDILRKLLNDSVNSALLLPDGRIIEKQDFTRAYKNWRYKYETGTYFKNRDGDLYTILDYHEEDSKGNPPAYRTEGNVKSPKYGQQIPTTAEERIRWKK